MDYIGKVINTQYPKIKLDGLMIYFDPQ